MSAPLLDACGICRSVHGDSRNPREIVFENDLWHLRHASAPYGVAGWLMLVTKAHTPGPWAFDDDLAAASGPTVRHVTRVMLEVTGALRVYTAWMGESWPHFHAHLVPRYAAMPKEAKAWGVFDLQRAAGAGEVEVDPAEVLRLTEGLRSAFAAAPLPGAARG